MPLNPTKAVEQARLLHEFHLTERQDLDIIRRYWKGRQRLPAIIPRGVPSEVRVMAASSRVNVMPIVVNSLVQSTFVDGFRTQDDDAKNVDVWTVWQANRMDARQTAIHRAAYGYGTSYAVVLPGDPVPVIRGVSPRSMTCLYGEDPDWPLWALERLGRGSWRLYDDEASYFLQVSDDGKFEWLDTQKHGAGVTPVVRFLDEDDLDEGDEPDAEDLTTWSHDVIVTRGQVAPLMPLQDQIDLTTFGLQIAQHYGAFRQRWIVGWAAKSEKEAVKAAASHVWTFDEEPDSIKLGEFEQTTLDGYIESREATLRHVATMSQTPVHELNGALINLSAEALAAADSSRERKVGERKTILGESHEQILWLSGRYAGIEVPNDAEVVWRDTSARAFAATVDGLGKLAQMLGVPPEELWERIPGTTQQDVRRWKAAAQNGNAFEQLMSNLERQDADGGAV
jgi:hypothetical protein